MASCGLLNFVFIAVDDLLVTDIQRKGVPMETVLSVQWSAPSKASPNNVLSYRAAITPPDVTESTTSTTDVSFSGRTQGTPYTVSVYTSVLRDPDHDTTTRIETTVPATSTPIYTSECNMRTVDFLLRSHGTARPVSVYLHNRWSFVCSFNARCNRRSVSIGYTHYRMFCVVAAYLHNNDSPIGLLQQIKKHQSSFCAK